jgi:hypothetical protein
MSEINFFDECQKLLYHKSLMSMFSMWNRLGHLIIVFMNSLLEHVTHNSLYIQSHMFCNKFQVSNDIDNLSEVEKVYKICFSVSEKDIYLNIIIRSVTFNVTSVLFSVLLYFSLSLLSHIRPRKSFGTH